MKKYIRVLCAFAMILSTCSGCFAENRNKPTYEVLVCGYSDSADIANLSVEYEFFDQESLKDYDIPTEKQVEVNGNVLHGKYHDSYPSLCNTYPEFIYKCVDGTRFTLDDNGNLVGLSYNYPIPDSIADVISPEDARTIAERFICQIIDISEYEVTIEGDDRFKSYYVYFYKYIGGYKAIEEIRVSIRYDGTLKAFASEMLDRVPIDTKVDDIDIDAAEKSIINKLDKIFADEKNSGRYKRIEYGNINYLLTILKDGSRALYCWLDVACYYDIVEGIELSKGERVYLVIPLPD